MHSNTTIKNAKFYHTTSAMELLSYGTYSHCGAVTNGDLVITPGFGFDAGRIIYKGVWFASLIGVLDKSGITIQVRPEPELVEVFDDTILGYFHEFGVKLEVIDSWRKGGKTVYGTRSHNVTVPRP